MKIIEQVRTGCSKHETGMRGGRRHYEWLDSYKTVFHDCLPGKEWLEAHYQDPYPEATIIILVDSAVKAEIKDWQFKRGTIKKVLAPYTSRIRVGRRMVVVPVGEADRKGV